MLKLKMLNKRVDHKHIERYKMKNLVNVIAVIILACALSGVSLVKMENSCNITVAAKNCAVQVGDLPSGSQEG
jgi:uncharacterized membrane protein